MDVDPDPTLHCLKDNENLVTRDRIVNDATSDFIGKLTEAEDEAYIVTGSSYKGTWNALGMDEVGRYVMPHGTVYEGGIRDGMFHGRGSFYWPEKHQRLDVVHLDGKLVEHGCYKFADGLDYKPKDWEYCKFPDRRFFVHKKEELRPSGRSLKTAKQPTKLLPFGCYDVGDGVFDPRTLRITSFDDPTKVLRIPSKDECEWIVNNCRNSWTQTTGYRPDLNENWSDNPPILPYNLAMSKDSPDPWWKRLTTFVRDRIVVVNGSENGASDTIPRSSFSQPEVCLCGQYILIGVPCCCTSSSASYEFQSDGSEVKKELHQEEINECVENEQVDSIENIFESAPDYSIELSSKIENERDVSIDVSPRNSDEFFNGAVSDEFMGGNPERDKKTELIEEKLLTSDYAMNIPREKVEQVTEPEMSNDRRMEQGFLSNVSQVATEEHHDQVSTDNQTESAGERSWLDLPLDQLNVEKNKEQESIESSENTTGYDNERESIEPSTVIETAKKNSNLESGPRNSEGSVESDFSEKTIQSILNDGAILSLQSIQSSETSIEQNLSGGEDIIEIYNEFKANAKTTAESSNTTVWRLSSASQDYDPQTKSRSKQKYSE